MKSKLLTAILVGLFFNFAKSQTQDSEAMQVGITGQNSVLVASTNVTIKGRVYTDLNHNCIPDPGEYSIPYATLVSSTGDYAYTDFNGNYTITSTSLNCTVQFFNLDTSLFTPSCPSSGSLNLHLDSLGQISTGNDFAVTYHGNLILGRVYDDVNQNCVQDNGETGIPWAIVTAMPGNAHGYTDANGNYAIHTTVSSNTLTVSNYSQGDLTPSCPATGQRAVNFSLPDSFVDSIDFAFHFTSNRIRGRVFNDANQNCVQDIGELGLQGYAVSVSPGNHYGHTDANGDYYVTTPNLNNTVTISNYGNNQLTPTCPSSLSIPVNFTGSPDTSNNNNFGFYFDPNYFNLGIHPGWSSSHPGFDKTYWTYYWNDSPNPHDAVVTFVYDSVLIVNSIPNGGVHFPTEHKIVWTFPALQPASWSERMDVHFTVPADFNIGDELCSYYEISPVIGDANPLDNTLYECNPVTGSHDPNAKTVYPSGDIHQSDSVLLYNIHFQNNGNDTAHTVFLIDTLSPFLDPATIVPGAASHPYTFTLSGHGVLTFRFDNIMLPDSNINEPASNGYVNYTVRQRPNNPVGTLIENTAAIYFDYNEPVITNTTSSLIPFPTGIELSEKRHEISVFPNPFSSSTSFSIMGGTPNSVYGFKLYDLMGREVKSIDKLGSNFTVEKGNLASNVYIYKINEKDVLIGTGKIMVEN